MLESIWTAITVDYESKKIIDVGFHNQNGEFNKIATFTKVKRQKLEIDKSMNAG